MKFSITTFQMTLSINTQHCDTQHNNKNVTLSIKRYWMFMLNVLYAEYHPSVLMLSASMLNVVAPYIC